MSEMPRHRTLSNGRRVRLTKDGERYPPKGRPATAEDIAVAVYGAKSTSAEVSSSDATYSDFFKEVDEDVANVIIKRLTNTALLALTLEQKAEVLRSQGVDIFALVDQAVDERRLVEFRSISPEEFVATEAYQSFTQHRTGATDA